MSPHRLCQAAADPHPTTMRPAAAAPSGSTTASLESRSTVPRAVRPVATSRPRSGPLTTVLIALLLVAGPALAAAQVRIVQNSCRTDGPNPVASFTLVTPGPAGPAVCQMTVLPVSAECFPLQCVAPEGWTCFPGDVTTFFQADAIPGGCVAPGASLSGFELGLQDGPCCLVFAFFDAAGAHLGTQEHCFDCGTVRAAPATWSRVKTLFE